LSGGCRPVNRSDGWKPLGQQCVMLQFVEIPAFRIAPLRLPELDRATRIVREISVRSASKIAERRQSPLDIAAFSLI
jgi:hypothetical protein